MGLKRTDEFRKDAVRIAADQWANAQGSSSTILVSACRRWTNGSQHT